MADGVWKGVDPLISGRSCQFLINKFFDLSALSMRKGRDGGKNGGKNLKKREKRLMKLAVNRPNADHWNAARSCQNFDRFFLVPPLGPKYQTIKKWTNPVL